MRANVHVVGDENEIEITVGESTYTGDLHQMSDDEEGPEIWQIDGDKFEVEQILSRTDLADLARSFLEGRGISCDGITVDSESFDE